MAGEIIPLSGQPSGQELWRSTLSAADRAKNERRYGDAEQLFQSALEQARPLQPDAAPAATIYNNLAGLYQDMGECGPALQAYQRSLDLWEQAGPRGEPYLLRTANYLVGAYLECGALREAERHYRELVAPRIATRLGGQTDPDVAQSLTNLGSIEYENRRYSQSRAAYEKALAIRERISAGPSVEMAILLNNLAFSLLRTGDTTAALAASRRSVAMFDSAGSPSDPLAISARGNAATLCLLTHRWPEAEALFDRALTDAATLLGEEHPLTALVLARYAVLLRKTHRKKEAAAVQSRVRNLQAASIHSAARETVDIRELSRMK